MSYQLYVPPHVSQAKPYPLLQRKNQPMPGPSIRQQGSCRPQSIKYPYAQLDSLSCSSKRKQRATPPRQQQQQQQQQCEQIQTLIPPCHEFCFCLFVVIIKNKPAFIIPQQQNQGHAITAATLQTSEFCRQEDEIKLTSSHSIHEKGSIIIIIIHIILPNYITRNGKKYQSFYFTDIPRRKR
ncbi:hypothetical protein CDL15_Pgr014509 [Punica granatum]|uniref:Uncharacterized protein n=1 Tax=Punica granatum TaxID=22663 RepID=A0A218WDT5_PUNGR|nr:hypothetical protein CDL15_Pgr014509 [Punica granatum]